MWSDRESLSGTCADILGEGAQEKRKEKGHPSLKLLMKLKIITIINK